MRPLNSSLVDIANELYHLGFDRFRIDGNYMDCEARAWKKDGTQSSIETRATTVELVMERLLAVAKFNAQIADMEEAITGEELLEGLRRLEKSPLNCGVANTLFSKAIEQWRKEKIPNAVFRQICEEHLRFPQLMGKVDDAVKKAWPKYRGKPLNEMTKEELIQALIEQANGLREAYEALDEYRRSGLM